MKWFVALLCLIAFWSCAQKSQQAFSDVESQYVTYNGAKVHYKVVGAGSHVVMFVHGFGCDMYAWQKQYDAFVSDTSLTMVFVDLPGYGMSQKPEVEYTLDFFAEALKAIVDSQNIEQLVLVGHSLGTPICRRFEQLYPEYCKALCDVDGVYCLYPTSEPELGMYEAAVNGFADSFMGDSVRENITGFVYSLSGKNTPKEILDYALSTMPNTPEYVASSTMHNLIDHRYWDGSVIEVPALIVCTKNSGVEPDNKEQMEQLYTNMTYWELDSCGHFIQWEESELFNQKLIKLINE